MMKFFKRFFVLLISISYLIVYLPGFAQLSGTYTIGGLAPDFSTISSATATLSQQGISGPVTFKIRAGTYPGFTVGVFNNPSLDSVRFESENLDATSVVISGNVILQNSKNVHFHRLTIKAPPSVQTSTIRFVHTDQCKIIECLIINPDSVNFSSDQALIKFETPWVGDYLSNSFVGCEIRSHLKTILITGIKGILYFTTNIFEGSLKSSSHNKIYYVNNILYLHHQNFADTYQSFTNNKFYHSGPGLLDVKGVFYNNTFYCSANLHTSEVFDNIFFERIITDYSYGIIVYGNVFLKGYECTYSHGGQYANNTFKGEVKINADNNTFWNNMFYDKLKITHGGNQRVFHNNFHRDAKLETHYIGGKIQNNNLGYLFVLQPAITHVYNNNFVRADPALVYYPGYYPTFYDPFYLDNDTILRARNPALTGKGSNLLPTFKFDADNVERKLIPSIGAHELCFDFQIDTVALNCYDSLSIDLCMDNFQDYFWTPSWMFTDSMVQNPVIYPLNSQTIYLNHLSAGVIDSFYVAFQDSFPTAMANYIAFGYTVKFFSYPGCVETWLWDFGNGATSDQQYPVHTYSLPGDYHCSLTVGNPHGSDTVYFTVIIDPTSISEYNELNVLCYPVPAKDKLCFRFSKEPVSFQFQLVDITGVIHYDMIIHHHEQCIPVETLSSGIYFAVFTSEKGRTVQKIIIQNF